MLSPVSLDEWQAYVDSHPESNTFHHRNWVKLISDQYGYPHYIAAVKQNGQIRAGIPFVETRGLWDCGKLISLPFTDCMRVLADNDLALREIQMGLEADEFKKYKAVVIRTDRAWRGVSSASAWVRHELGISGSLGENVANFSPSLKRNLRRGEKSKLQFERQMDWDAVEKFYLLHLMTRKKLGSPVQPKSYFRLLHERILRQGLGFIGLVMKGDSAIAAGVFLTYQKTMTYKYGASNPRALEHRPNEWMMFNAIRFAVERGYRWFDFGISRRGDEGLRRFKKKWGAVETDVLDNYVVGTKERLVEDSPLFKIASVAIRHSPAVIGRALGEMAYRFRY